MISLPLYLQSIHDKELKRNLHTAGSCSSLSECSLGIHSMFSLLYLTVNVHHKQPQQVMDFSLFLLALYLLWDNFLISEMTTRHVNNTTKKSQHFHSCMIFGFERGVNEMCTFWGDFTQRRLIVSCRRLGTTVGDGEILTAVLVKIKVIWDVSPCRLVNLPASSGPTAQDVTFVIPSSHPRFYRSRSLSLL